MRRYGIHEETALRAASSQPPSKPRSLEERKLASDRFGYVRRVSSCGLRHRPSALGRQTISLVLMRAQYLLDRLQPTLRVGDVVADGSPPLYFGLQPLDAAAAVPDGLFGLLRRVGFHGRAT